MTPNAQPIPPEFQPPPVTGCTTTDGLAVIQHLIAGGPIVCVADEQIAQAIHVAPTLYAGDPSPVLVRAVNRAVDELSATQRRRAAFAAEIDAAIQAIDASPRPVPPGSGSRAVLKPGPAPSSSPDGAALETPGRVSRDYPIELTPEQQIEQRAIDASEYTRRLAAAGRPTTAAPMRFKPAAPRDRFEDF